jgi:broad specificity phosphatase PhoE
MEVYLIRHGETGGNQAHRHQPEDISLNKRGKTDGGESYQDLRHRIAKAKSHFRSYPENARVVVVSHSVFINLFLVHMCHEDEINLFTASKAFMKILTMKNTELIPLIYDPETHTDTCGWFQDKT